MILSLLYVYNRLYKCHGHPAGSSVGATAMRQAVDATMKGEGLEECGKTHGELMDALSFWGKVRF